MNALAGFTIRTCNFHIGLFQTGARWTVEVHRDLDGYKTLVVEHGGAAIAWLGWCRFKHTLQIGAVLVSPRYRGRGIAGALIDLLLAAEQPEHVSVTVVSDRGKTMIRAAMDRHLEVAWTVRENGERRLRDLKPARAA